jgi:hypothetical protein
MDKRPSLRPATSCCFAPMSRLLREERRSDPASCNCAVNHQNRISTRTDDRKGDRWFHLLLRADLSRHQAGREASSGNHWTLHLVSWGRRCLINRRTPTFRSTVESSIVNTTNGEHFPTLRVWWMGYGLVSGCSLLKSYHSLQCCIVSSPPGTGVRPAAWVCNDQHFPNRALPVPGSRHDGPRHPHIRHKQMFGPTIIPLTRSRDSTIRSLFDTNTHAPSLTPVYPGL